MKKKLVFLVGLLFLTVGLTSCVKNLFPIELPTNEPWVYEKTDGEFFYEVRITLVDLRELSENTEPAILVSMSVKKGEEALFGMISDGKKSFNTITAKGVDVLKAAQDISTKESIVKIVLQNDGKSINFTFDDKDDPSLNRSFTMQRTQVIKL